jgi:hypothetical protein
VMIGKHPECTQNTRGNTQTGLRMGGKLLRRHQNTLGTLRSPLKPTRNTQNDCGRRITPTDWMRTTQNVRRTPTVISICTWNTPTGLRRPQTLRRASEGAQNTQNGLRMSANTQNVDDTLRLARECTQNAHKCPRVHSDHTVNGKTLSTASKCRRNTRNGPGTYSITPKNACDTLHTARTHNRPNKEMRAKHSQWTRNRQQHAAEPRTHSRRSTQPHNACNTQINRRRCVRKTRKTRSKLHKARKLSECTQNALKTCFGKPGKHERTTDSEPLSESRKRKSTTHRERPPRAGSLSTPPTSTCSRTPPRCPLCVRPKGLFDPPLQWPLTAWPRRVIRRGGKRREPNRSNEVRSRLRKKNKDKQT